MFYNETTKKYSPFVSNIGLVVANNTQNVILAAGHAGRVGESIGIKYLNENKTDTLGVVSARVYSIQNMTNSSSDVMAITPVTTINYDLKLNQIIQNNGTIYDVTKSSGWDYGSSVMLVGKDQDKPGTITYANVTVSNGPGLYFTNMVLANYNSTEGDSGGPVIFHNGTDTLFYGMHSGKFCEIVFEEHGGYTYHNWILNGTDKICNREHITLRGFSTWDSISKDLNLQ